MAGIVIVGGGQAGFSAASTLRKFKYDEEIMLICDELSIPYQRPPLSKKFLLGDIPKERLFFRPMSYYKENKIDVKCGVEATKIDRESQTLVIGKQKILSYDRLILTTGAIPNKFPKRVGGQLRGVYYLRSIRDVERISLELKATKHVLIVGGGYIGLEIAAVARRKKLKVTLVEAESRILKRVASDSTASYLRQLHIKENVRILEGVSVEKLEGEKGYLSSAVLNNGDKFKVDFAIVGIGVIPNTKLASDAGLDLDNGIKVDTFCQTSDPNILAAGDCTSFPYNNRRIRLESVGNAIEQGEKAAMTVLGRRQPYIARPWFWSDQYETKLQIAGLSDLFDMVVERKNKESVSFWYYNKDKLIAVDAINDGRAYMIGKTLIENGVSPSPSLLSDVNLNLKLLLKRI
tara:strand:- start:312 stop:1526 length:1215 start_codon:yes stop_codon:yes gene_type:complete